MKNQNSNNVITLNRMAIVFALFFCLIQTNNSLSQWVHCGLDTEYVYSLYCQGNIIFAGTDTLGIFYSTNNGVNWVHTSLNNRTVGAITSAGNYIFAGTEFNGVYRSSDFGGTWAQTSLNNESVRAFAVNSGSVYAGTIVMGVYISTNLGVSWTQHNLNYRNVLSAAENTNNIFAGTNSGLMKSTNSGMNWETTSLVSVLIPTIVSANNNLYASVYLNPSDYGKIIMSTDNGLNWSPTSFTGNFPFSILINGNNFFVGSMTNGFFLSTNNGITWSQHNEGFPSPIYLRSLCLINNWLIAGTFAHGVWRRNLNELIGITPISKEVPTHFALYQNYPNPFNPATTIEFDIPKNQFPLNKGGGFSRGLSAKISVYNITGQLVATLVNEPLAPGKYKVEFNAGNLSSGIYFYKLQSGDFISTKKMILIK